VSVPLFNYSLFFSNFCYPLNFLLFSSLFRSDPFENALILYTAFLFMPFSGTSPRPSPFPPPCGPSNLSPPPGSRLRLFVFCCSRLSVFLGFLCGGCAGALVPFPSPLVEGSLCLLFFLVSFVLRLGSILLGVVFFVFFVSSYEGVFFFLGAPLSLFFGFSSCSFFSRIFTMLLPLGGSCG